jgi:hypothetical protein
MVNSLTTVDNATTQELVNNKTMSDQTKDKAAINANM